MKQEAGQETDTERCSSDEFCLSFHLPCLSLANEDMFGNCQIDHVDVCINNAGVTGMENGYKRWDLEDTTAEVCLRPVHGLPL